MPGVAGSTFQSSLEATQGGSALTVGIATYPDQLISYPASGNPTTGGAAAQIQAAINLLATNGGGRVMLVGGPTNVLYLESTVVLKQGVQLDTDGVICRAIASGGTWNTITINGVTYSAIFQTDQTNQYGASGTQGYINQLSVDANNVPDSIAIEFTSMVYTTFDVSAKNATVGVQLDIQQSNTQPLYSSLNQQNTGIVNTVSCATGLKVLGSAGKQCTNNTILSAGLVNCMVRGFDFAQYCDHNLVYFSLVSNPTAGSTGLIFCDFGSLATAASLRVNGNGIYHMGTSLNGSDASAVMFNIGYGATDNHIDYGEVNSIPTAGTVNPNAGWNYVANHNVNGTPPDYFVGIGSYGGPPSGDNAAGNMVPFSREMNNPTGTTSTTFVNMGLGVGQSVGAQAHPWVIQPTNQGQVRVGAAMTVDNQTATDGGSVQLCYGLISLAANYLGTWSSATAYVVGNVVLLNGQYYTCIENNTNETPPNATYWTAIVPVNGAAATGTVIGQTYPFKSQTASQAGFAYLTKILYGSGALTVNALYWFDIQLETSGGGTAVAYNIEAEAVEF